MRASQALARHITSQQSVTTPSLLARPRKLRQQQDPYLHHPRRAHAAHQRGVVGRGRLVSKPTQPSRIPVQRMRPRAPAHQTHRTEVIRTAADEASPAPDSPVESASCPAQEWEGWRRAGDSCAADLVDVCS